MSKTIYICEYCQKHYNTQLAAQLCEIRHQQDKNDPQYVNREILMKIIREDNTPCLFCEHSYLVYGSELNCECDLHCKEYSHFQFINKNLI